MLADLVGDGCGEEDGGWCGAVDELLDGLRGGLGVEGGTDAGEVAEGMGLAGDEAEESGLDLDIGAGHDLAEGEIDVGSDGVADGVAHGAE